MAEICYFWHQLFVGRLFGLLSAENQRIDRGDG